MSDIAILTEGMLLTILDGYNLLNLHRWSPVDLLVEDFHVALHDAALRYKSQRPRKLCTYHDEDRLWLPLSLRVVEMIER